MLDPLAIRPTAESEAIFVMLGNDEGWKEVDAIIFDLFARMQPDWETWLGVAAIETYRPRYVDLVLAAVDEFQKVDNPRLALLMLAQGYSEAAMIGTEKKKINRQIVEAMQKSPIWAMGMQDEMPNAAWVYSRANIIIDNG